MQIKNQKIAALASFGALSLALLASAGSAQATLVNGSFEDTGSTYIGDGRGAMVLPANSTVIPGWTIINGPADWDKNPAFGLAAHAGSFFLDLTDDESTPQIAGVQQTISTVAGITYQVSFWLGSSSQYNIGSTAPTMTVSATGTSAQTFTGIGHNAPAVNYWQEFNYTFVANSTSTVLTLQGGSVGSGPGLNEYVGLDDVSLTAVPEASTFIAGGLLLLVFLPGAVRGIRQMRAA